MFEIVQVSALPSRYGRQSYDEVVGAEPNFTYRSASPVPPLVTTFRLVAPDGTARVYRRDAPCAPDRRVTGTPLLSEPPPPPLVTFSAIVVVLVVVPEVAVTVTFAVPVVAVLDAVKVSVDDAVPFAAGVTDDGLNDAVTPAGRPDAVRLVAELKPPVLVTVTVEVPVAPCATDSEDGFALTV